MRVLSLRMKNFRQFFGESPTMRFATGDQNISVIHGSNGSGKTALLNAFTWTLFDSFTRGFQYPDQLINKMALRKTREGETVDAWVELEFDHGDRKYVLRRTVEALRTATDPGWEMRGDSRATLQWCGADGKWADQDRVGDAIGRILPKDLHGYFFFDGERIERIVQASKDEQKLLGEATKKLLGIEILVRGEHHLRRVQKELENELGEIGDPETKRLLDAKAECEKKREDQEARYEELEANVEGEKARKREIENRLRQLEDVRAIQERRDDLNRDRDQRRDTLVQGWNELAGVVSASGYSVFLRPAVEGFRGLIDDLRSRGELPAGIKRQFVDDLLTKGTCICDRPLEVGAAERRTVESWRERAGLADVEEKAIRMGGEVTVLETGTPDTLARIDKIQKRRFAAREALARIERELDDINEKLKNSPREEISGLQRQLNEADAAIDEAHRDQGACRRSISDLDAKIEEHEQAIQKHRSKENSQRVAQARVDMARDAGARIGRVRDLLEENFRRQLSERVTKLFEKMSVTPYVPDLTESWGLRLLESAGGDPLPVAASQGESQILSLAFIGSIIEQAREMQARKDRLPGPGSAVYPVVMDSPFGSLDPNYRHQVAEHLPELADQVILMVTRTQWRGEVERSLAGRVGRSYVLTYFTPRPDVDEDAIELHGQSYNLIKRSPSEFEYTQLVEVDHG